MHFRRPRAVAWWGLAVVLLLTGCGGQAYQFQGGEIEPARAAAPLDLTDQDGEPFSLEDAAGKVRLVYFGYTTCPDLCPTTLLDFAAVKDELGDQAEDVQFLMVTFDPERDTTARLKEYLGFFDEDFVGLRGSAEETETFKKEYGVSVNRVEYPESSTGYLLDHSALVYVIDKEGRLRLTFPYGTSPETMAEDVRHLVDEE